ncbi:MAG: hypothetical protein IJG53_01395 [Eggerthellaceae bacterium]|nr:hypothetical protein [Eggerthellaceae bacterium]
MESSEVSRRDMLKVIGGAAAGALGAGALAGMSGCSKTEVIGVEYISGESESLWLYNPSGVRQDGQYVDKQLKATMDAAGIDKPPFAARSNTRVESAVVSAATAYDDITDLFYKRGWTDGLPIVPPHERKVSLMCKGTDLPRESLIAIMPPLMGQATVEKVATNAVMAGCRPEYLPVLIAAVEGVCDDAYDLVGVGTTTSPNASMIVVNGPIAKALNINSGANCLGRGHKANATIGRALHLCEQNIGGAWPRVSDFSSLGMPGDYSWMMAENEDESPWEPYHVEQGFSADQNIVTVLSGSGMHLIVDIGLSNTEYLDKVAAYMAQNNHHERQTLVVQPPYTAQDLANDGWDKPKMREYITKKFTEITGEAVEGVLPLMFIVAGGVGEKNYVIPMWRKAISREVRLPKGWDVHLTPEDE